MEIKKRLLILIFVGILLVSGCVKEKITEEIVEANESEAEEEGVEEVRAIQSNATSEKTEWWKPKPDTSWQWQLKGSLNTNYNVEMYDLDLFDNSKEAIKALQDKGIKVICYFSAGSYEDWRVD